MSAFWSAD